MAIDRRLGDEAAFGPEQALPVEVALAAYTSAPARTLGIGLGQITPGAPATLTVVEGDLSRPSGRRTATIGATVVAGEIVYGQLS
jgi:predicted amidohydrolase YtcJ